MSGSLLTDDATAGNATADTVALYDDEAVIEHAIAALNRWLPAEAA